MDAATLLTDLHNRDFTLRIREDGLLGVTPAERLSAEDRAALKEHKEALLDLLWTLPHPSDDRAIGWPHESANWNGSGWNWRPVKEEKDDEQEEGQG